MHAPLVTLEVGLSAWPICDEHLIDGRGTMRIEDKDRLHALIALLEQSHYEDTTVVSAYDVGRILDRRIDCRLSHDLIAVEKLELVSVIEALNQEGLEVDQRDRLIVGMA